MVVAVTTANGRGGIGDDEVPDKGPNPGHEPPEKGKRRTPDTLDVPTCGEDDDIFEFTRFVFGAFELSFESDKFSQVGEWSLSQE